MFRSERLFCFLQCIMPGTLLSLCTAATLVAQIPQFEWAIQFGGSSNELIRAMDTDAEGNIYAVGEYSGTVDFDPGPGTFELTTPNLGGFILKLDPDGAFIWARSLNASVNTFAINDISVDPSGNAWVIGTFGGTMDVNPGPGVLTITSAGLADVFFLRLDPDGVLLRSGRGGGPEDDTGNGIVTDDQGNAYMTGRVRQNAVFQSNTNTASDVVSGFNEPDAFVLKLPPSGDFEWYENLGGFFWDEGNAIALDDQENVIVTGVLSGPSDFGQSNPNILPGDGTKDIFVCKLSNSGVVMWVHSVGPGQEDIARDIAIDAQGDIYTTGTFHSTIDFDPGAGVSMLDADDGRRTFIQKLTSMGNFSWATTLESTNNNWGSSISVGPSGAVVSTGYFQATTDMDPGPGVANLISSGDGLDCFIQVLDGNGNYQWAGAIGAAGIDDGRAVTIDPTGAIHVGGLFQQTVDMDPGTGVYNLISAGNRDAFLLKLYPGINVSIAEEVTGPDMRLWPNPCDGESFQIKLPDASSSGVRWVTVRDVLGRMVSGPFQTLPSMDGLLSVELEQVLPTGIYTVAVEADGVLLEGQLVVQ